MTLQEEFEQQYEAANAFPAGFMLARRMGEAYSEPHDSRAYRWFVRGRSFGLGEEAAMNRLDDSGCDISSCDGWVRVDKIFNRQDWIAIGSLMGWIPEKEK